MRECARAFFHVKSLMYRSRVLYCGYTSLITFMLLNAMDPNSTGSEILWPPNFWSKYLLVFFFCKININGNIFYLYFFSIPQHYILVLCLSNIYSFQLCYNVFQTFVMQCNNLFQWLCLQACQTDFNLYIFSAK